MPAPIWLYAALAAVAVAIGAYAYIDHEARVSERNAAAARTFQESENARKLRETNDGSARRLDDDAALRCLRNPAGCR
jgi:hypothetical protein